MKLFVRSLCLALACATAFLAQAQEDSLNLKFDFQLTERKPLATLDKLSQSLLNDPYVLVEIGVKRSQIALVPFRDKINKLIATMGAAQAFASEDITEGGAIAAHAKRSFEAPAGILYNFDEWYVPKAQQRYTSG